MIVMRVIQWFLFTVILSSVVMAAPFRFDRFVSPNAVIIGDSVEFSVVVTHNPTVQIKGIDFKGTPGFQFVTDEQTVQQVESFRVITFRWVGRVFDVGQLEIPEQLIRYIYKNQHKSVSVPPISIPVNSLLTSENRQLKGIYAPFEAQLDVQKVALRSIVWLIAIIGLIIVVYLIVKRFVKPPSEEESVVEEIQDLRSPEDKAHDRLAELKRKRYLEEGHVEAYYLMFSEIIRRYLMDRFDESCLERTSYEILRAFQTKIDENSHRRLNHMLETCDFVKFARYIPEYEVSEQLIQKFEQFMQSSALLDNVEESE